MSTLRALLMAATAFLRIAPLVLLRNLHKDIDSYEDQIHHIGSGNVTPSDELQLESIAKRKRRTDQLISTLRSQLNNTDKG